MSGTLFKSSFSSRARAFALIELLVVIAIIAILAAILFPVFARARESARRASCQSNLKQIGLGIAQYSQDYDEKYPTDNGGGGTPYSATTVYDDPGGWINKIMPYVKSKQIFVCGSSKPSSSNPTGVGLEQSTSYWAAGGVFKAQFNNVYSPIALAAILKPAETPQVYDNLSGDFEAHRVFRPYWVTSSLYSHVGSFTTVRPGTHFDGMNSLYVDGHVKWVKLVTLYLQMCPQWTQATSTTGVACSAPTDTN